MIVMSEYVLYCYFGPGADVFAAFVAASVALLLLLSSRAYLPCELEKRRSPNMGFLSILRLVGCPEILPLGSTS